MAVLRFFTKKQYMEFFKEGIEDLKQKTISRLNEKWILDPKYMYTLDTCYQPYKFRRPYHFTYPQKYREFIAIKHYASVNKFDIRWEKIKLIGYILSSPLIMIFPLLFVRPHRFLVPDWLRYYLFDEEEYITMHQDYLNYIEQCYIDYEEEKKLRNQNIL